MTASATSDVATASVGPTVAFAPSTDNTASRTERVSTDREGGRGGRGGRGRGRGRAPIPSGRVFFTGSEKPASASAKKRSPAGSSSASSGKTKNKDSETTEEVVGQLDTAIGTSKDKKSAGEKSANKSSTTANNSGVDYFEETPTETVAKVSFVLEGFMYDSDSSREEERANNSATKHSLIPPLELPFPSQPLPLGVGSTERPVAYEKVMQSDSKNNEHLLASLNHDLSEASVSPFVDGREADQQSSEQNSWFLVQLPTRLPPLQPLTADGPIPVPTYSAEDPTDGTTTAAGDPHSQISEVVTPPLAANSHDNVLTNTASGRIGKIIVYKSGKTVLKMEGPDGSNPVFLNVDEGLTAGFLQQAVVIDPDDSKFIALGNINKSIVVTPDLSSALVAE